MYLNPIVKIKKIDKIELNFFVLKAELHSSELLPCLNKNVFINLGKKFN